MGWQFKEFCTRITEINSTINEIKIKEAEKIGLKGSHVMLLHELDKHSEGMTGADIAAILCLDKAAVSRSIAELAEKDLISIDESQSGRRYRAAIKLTPDGKKAAKMLENKIASAVGAGTVAELSDEQRQKFYYVLSQISQNLKAYSESL